MATQNGGQQFKASFARWRDRFTNEQLPALVRQTVQEISSRVVNATPVDTGFLRSSWQPAIGSAAPRLEKVKRPKDGAGSAEEAKARIGLVVNGMQVGDHYWLINNAAYALRLEYGFVGKDELGRTYNQTGRFFVTRNVKAWPLVVSQVARELTK